MILEWCCAVLYKSRQAHTFLRQIHYSGCIFQTAYGCLVYTCIVTRMCSCHLYVCVLFCNEANWEHSQRWYCMQDFERSAVLSYVMLDAHAALFFCLRRCVAVCRITCLHPHAFRLQNIDTIWRCLLASEAADQKHYASCLSSCIVIRKPLGAEIALTSEHDIFCRRNVSDDVFKWVDMARQRKCMYGRIDLYLSIPPAYVRRCMVAFLTH
jgi:hypothetical protein